jgi:hypothetical protein
MGFAGEVAGLRLVCCVVSADVAQVREPLTMQGVGAEGQAGYAVRRMQCRATDVLHVWEGLAVVVC